MDFTIALAVPRIHIADGESATVGVALGRNVFADEVNITVAGLPAGITADPLVLTGNNGTLTFHASSGAPQGEAQLTVTAQGGSRSHDVPLAMLAMGPPGSADQTFTRSAAGTSGHPIAGHSTSVIVQADGKLVIAGVLTTAAGDSDGAFVARYLPDGRLDQGFAGGVVTVRETSNTPDTARAAVVQQSDGKLILAWTVGFAQSHGLVVRLTPEGLLDDQFGSGGKQRVDLNELGAASATTLNAIAVQPDGGIVVAGSTHVLQSATDTVAAVVARLTPTGELDNSFGTMGRTTTSFGTTGADLYALLLQPDGRIFAAGVARPSQHKIAAFARFDHEGRLDHSFDSDGLLTRDIGSPSTATDDFVGAVSIARQADAKLVIAGDASTTGASNNACLIRLNEDDGSTDTNFGTGGVKVLGISLLGNTDGLAGLGFALQRDGKFLVAGSAVVQGIQANFVARLNPSTDLDFGFGAGQGMVTTPIPTIGTGDEGGGYSAIALDADDRLVVAGYYTVTRGADQIILDRFWP